MVAANAEGRLPFVLGDRLIRQGPRELTLDEVVDLTALSPDMVRRIWRALGYAEHPADEVAYTESDVRVLQMIAVIIDTLGEAGAIQFVRVVGSSLARIAETGFTLGLSEVEGGFLAHASSLVEAAQAAQLLGVLSQFAPSLFDPIFRRHIELVARNSDRTPSDRPDTAPRAIGFADMVDFTTMTNASSVAELAGAVDDLETIANAAVSAVGGRLVKLIGDEVMFAANTADDGCEIALRLLEGAAQHPTLPMLRASLAVGSVVLFEGDYFGPVVNLASRLASKAGAGELLVSKETTDMLDLARFSVGAATPLTLRGFAAPAMAAPVERLRHRPPSRAA
jgi:adenylate cyclase